MSAPSFEPADGEKARWRHCYELALSVESGTQITYHEVMDLLDCDLPSARAAMDQARKRLEADGHLSVVTERGRGWVRAHAADMLVSANKRGRKVRRQVSWAVNTLHATPRESLTPFQRQDLDQSLMRASALESLIKRREVTPLADLNKKRREVS